MRNFDFDRDPLRLELLPKGWDREPLAFSYRASGTREGETKNPFTPYLLLTLSTMTLGGVLALRVFCHLVPLGPVIFSWQVLGLIVLIALADAVPSFLSDEPRSTWLTLFLLPFFGWLTIAYIIQPTWLLLPVVLIATIAIADSLAGNYLSWLLADVRADYDTRTLLRDRWKRRFGREAWFCALMGLFGRSAQPRVLDLYPARLLALGAAFLVTLAFVSRHQELGDGIAAVGILLGLLLVSALFLPRLVGLESTSPGRQLAAVVRAIDNWINYNPRDRRAPGLYQSPYGTTSMRIGLAAAALIATSAAINLTASYFPVIALRRDGALSWARIYAELRQKPLKERITEQFRPEPERVPADGSDLGAVERDLHVAELLFYQELQGEEAKRSYLREVAERRRKEAARVVVYSEDLRAVARSPEGWLLPNLFGMLRGETIYLWSFLLSCLLGVLIPPLYLLIACWATTGYDLALVEYRLTHPRWRQHPREPDARPEESGAWYNPEWLGFVESLHHSTHPIERESLFLGLAQEFTTDDQIPVLMPRSMLREHVHITGDSGSGKSSRGTATVAAQLARFTRERGDCSIVVIDLKGDSALFHGLRHEARGLPFQWYRDQTGFASYGFNPLLQSHIDLFDPAQKARAVMDSFGLRHGDTFGERYFADIQEAVLRRVFEQHTDIRSLAQMHDLLMRPEARQRYCPDMPQRDWEHGYHVREQLGAFARCQPLNDLTEEPGQRIDLASAFIRPQIIYYWVPALLGGGANQQAAKFALYSLLTAALFLSGGRRHQVYCFIDEFQEIAGANIGVILRQARQFDVSMLLSNQSLSDLDRGGVKLTNTLSGTIGFRWSFRASDLRQQKELMEASGEYVRWMRTVSRSVSVQQGDTAGPTWSFGVNVSERHRPHLERNHLLYASFVDHYSIAHFAQGKGFNQFFRPFVLRTMFHINEELYQKRSLESWPLLPWPPGASSRDRSRRRHERRSPGTGRIVFPHLSP